MTSYFDIAFGPGAVQHQRERGSYESYAAASAPPTDGALGPGEAQFLAERDSFYLASIGSNGWPYVQHRGGPAGFIRVLGSDRIAWADRSGNQQFVSAGNIDDDDRVALIAVDYPTRRRLKLFGHATFDPDPSRSLLRELEIDGRMEGLVTVSVVASDWNCPKYITRRYTEREVSTMTEPLLRRIEELESRLAPPSPGGPAPGA